MLMRIVLLQLLSYATTLLALAAIYLGFRAVFSGLIDFNTTIIGLPIFVLPVLVLALIFQPVRQSVSYILNRLLYRNQYDVDEFVAQLGSILTSNTDLRQMLTQAADKIETTMGARTVDFVIYQKDGQPCDIVMSGARLRLGDHDCRQIRSFLGSHDQAILLVRELIKKQMKGDDVRLVYDLMRKHGFEFILDLGSAGFVAIGLHRYGQYTERDLRALATIRNELEIAVQNAQSLRAVHDVNAYLEQRIAKATEQIRRSNSKLRKLDTTKDEFLSMASHQLRTPLTSVKGYLSMVLDGDAGEITDQQRQLLGEAFVSSERMVQLVGDFLNVSRIQTGKFVLDRHPVDLSAIVEEEVDGMMRLAEVHDMALTYRKPKHFPTLNVDTDKLRQVVMNFIDNAIYYSRPNSTIVVKLSHDEREIKLEVHDHGIGVPRAALRDLGTKFFRADNAKRQRPDGTGVGLYLAKKVIAEHGGKIIIESTEGKGSVFGFSLPVDFGK